MQLYSTGVLYSPSLRSHPLKLTISVKTRPIILISNKDIDSFKDFKSVEFEKVTIRTDTMNSKTDAVKINFRMF